MFDKSPHLYDLLYEKGLGKDYAAEVAGIVDRLPNARTLLDVACGTGLHLQHLTRDFDCVGTDLDAGMLDLARRRCPDVELIQADMVELDLGRTFDAVVCLFSSIGYLETEERLRAAIAAMARHLSPGGTLLVEPWLTPDLWTDGHIGMLTVDEPQVKICRINRHGSRTAPRSWTSTTWWSPPTASSASPRTTASGCSPGSSIDARSRTRA